MPASYRYANTPLGLTVQNRRYNSPYTRPQRPATIQVSSHAEYNVLTASERARAKFPDTLRRQSSPPPAPVQAPSHKRAASPTPISSEPQPKRSRAVSPDPREHHIRELKLLVRHQNEERAQMQKKLHWLHCTLIASESISRLFSHENKALEKQVIVMANELQYSHRTIADIRARCALEVDEANDAAFKRSTAREEALRGERHQLEKDIGAFEEEKRKIRTELESAKELATQRGHRNEAIRAENDDLKADLAEKDLQIAALKASVHVEPQPSPTYTSLFPEMQSYSEPTPATTSPYSQMQSQPLFYSETAPAYFSPYPQAQSPSSEPFHSFAHLAQIPAPAFSYESQHDYSEPSKHMLYSEPPQHADSEPPRDADSESPQQSDSEPPRRVYSKLPRRTVYYEPPKPVCSEPPPEASSSMPKPAEPAEIFDDGRAVEEEAARVKATRAVEKAAQDAMVAAKQEALKAQLAAEALSGFADTAVPPPEFAAPSSGSVARKRMSAKERAVRQAKGMPRRKF